MASSVVSVPVTRLRIGQANLFYRLAAAADWEKLPPTYHEKWNVFAIDIQFGSIKITQKFPLGAGTCILTLTPANYRNIRMDTDDEMAGTADVLFEMELASVPACELSRSMAGNNGKLTFSFLEASVFHTFCRRLVFGALAAFNLFL